MPRLLFLTFFVYICIIGKSQQVLTGKVLDQVTKQPISGAEVLVIGDSISLTTNDKGYFQFRIQVKDSIVILHNNYYPSQFSRPTNDVFTVFLYPYDERPIYLAGNASFYKYLHKQLRYPFKSIIRQKEGIQLIRLTINAQGKFVDCACMNDIGIDCDKKIKPVIENIPGSWAAIGKSQNLVLPIIFTLSNTPKSYPLPEVDLTNTQLMDKIVISGVSE